MATCLICPDGPTMTGAQLINHMETTHPAPNPEGFAPKPTPEPEPTPAPLRYQYAEHIRQATIGLLQLAGQLQATIDQTHERIAQAIEEEARRIEEEATNDPRSEAIGHHTAGIYAAAHIARHQQKRANTNQN